MTSSISSLSAVAALLDPTAATPSSLTPMPSWSTVRNDVLTAVSGKLGISSADLTTQLKTGKSMADIAKAAGVSSDDLTATIEASLAQSGLPAGINLAAMATRMSNNVNNASLDDSPTAAPTTAAPSAASTSLGIDTSALQDVSVGGLSLDSSEISVLLGGTGSGLDTYL